MSSQVKGTPKLPEIKVELKQEQTCQSGAGVEAP